MKVNCNRCKNYASYYCRDCVHRLGVGDFFREADYETVSSEVNNGESNEQEKV